MRLSRHLTRHAPLSRHAETRMQQRAIPRFIVELLLDCTDPVPAGDGCVMHRFNAVSWAEARLELGRSASQLDRYRNAYAIIGAGGLVVTVGRIH